jgi:hypothetical protein
MKKDIKRRLKEFKKTLEENEVLEEFERCVFESVVEKVIVGILYNYWIYKTAKLRLN